MPCNNFLPDDAHTDSIEVSTALRNNSMHHDFPSVRRLVLHKECSAQPLQYQFMQGEPKETPKRRQMLAFTKVSDLLSKPSETAEGDCDY